MITEEITEILRIADTMGGYQKNKMLQICKKLAAKYNSEVARRESLALREYKIKGTYKDWVEKLVHVTMMHGYNEDNIFELNDKFIAWMKNNATEKFKANKMTREMLTSMSTEFFMFKMDNERDPVDYEEFRNYLISLKDAD